MANAKKTYVYKDPKILRGVLLALMALSAVVAVGSILVVAIFGEASSYDGSEIDLTTAQLLRAATDIGYLMMIVAIVVAAFWILQVSRNAHSFKPAMEHSVGGSVGWYFIPFANWIVPYTVMGEIWDASTAPGQRKTMVLGVWWAAWLGWNLISAGINVVSRISTTPPSAYLDIIFAVLQIAALAAFGLLIHSLTRRQRQMEATRVFSDPTRDAAAPALQNA